MARPPLQEVVFLPRNDTGNGWSVMCWNCATTWRLSDEARDKAKRNGKAKCPACYAKWRLTASKGAGMYQGMQRKVSENALKLREALSRPNGEVPTTMSGLAKVLGVSRQAVHQWVTGRSKPGLEFCRKMSSLYGLRMEDW